MRPTDNADLFRSVSQSHSALTGTDEAVRRTIDRIPAASRRRNAKPGEKPEPLVREVRLSPRGRTFRVRGALAEPGFHSGNP